MNLTSKQILTLLISNFIVLQHASAWVLDKRCDDLGYGDLVRRGMAKALDMAQAAQDTLQALKDGTHNEAQMDLFEYMFSFAVEGNGNNRRLKMDEWERIVNTYTEVLKFAPVRQPDEDIPTTEVVIYCDYSRYIEGQSCSGKKKRNLACDKDTSLTNKINFVWRQCKSTVAMVPAMALTSSNGSRRFAQMDLCGWYLRFVSTSKKQFWSDISAKSILAKPLHEVFNARYLRSEMDASALLDHTILHELTHALSQDDTDDVGGMRSYGWRRSVEIGKTSKFWRNADNYAYFGLAARMISPRDGTSAARPNKDGSTSALTVASEQLL
ncbi:hypothetical protein P170DRAFT_474405 [Aspergillus steynii IBT 23096]|uniref:Uncharacterized protein n=1 Tax=Aspergillus steynii IBT 23096 TaxID=1392250 RepID=A0A2I2GDG8_9EURO|nr:uncharacterized protein P170DRAFT_474405 [Aspergillus steynii IBT 23096]PLB50857.1 hypothetical protein P170DRAFT_474405 [Aspergillus steynii IBT 23096]